MYAVDVLEEGGFAVVGAEAGLLALHARPEVQVLFTDVNMPGRIEGLELARIARAQFPHMGALSRCYVQAR
jgi:CheY-like chemotaxis protein